MAAAPARDSRPAVISQISQVRPLAGVKRERSISSQDRKSTRLNSSHLVISYAVFCLKKKKNNEFLSISLIVAPTPVEDELKKDYPVSVPYETHGLQSTISIQIQQFLIALTYDYLNLI